MPLLRLKPFKPEVPPAHLKGEDEVFLCDLTGEIFTSYESFYQRMILCNSLVWSCEISGKMNLTFKEAQDCEKNIRKSLSAIPYSLKLAILYLTHHTRRSKIQELTDEIFKYLNTRFQIDEKIEVKLNDKWYVGITSEIPFYVDVSLMNKIFNQKIMLSPLNSPGKDRLREFHRIITEHKAKSPLVNKELLHETAEFNYKVLMLKGPKKGETVILKAKYMRRSKNGIFVKDKVKLFIKQMCQRTTVSSEEGYWVVKPKETLKFALGESSIKPPTTLLNIKNKKTKEKGKTLSSYKKTYTDRPRDLSLEQKKLEQKKLEEKKLEQKKLEQTLEQMKIEKQLEEQMEKERKRVELELLREQRLKKIEDEKALREQKIKEKEEEKARKKDEREKERELNNELKKLELNFVREFNKPREDLQLEDSKPLPALLPLNSGIDKELVGDTIMVVEFVNTFGALLDLQQEIDAKITFNWLEEALTEHDAEGNYYTILKFLLHSYLRLDKEENSHHDDEDEDGSSSDDEGDTSTVKQQQNVPEVLAQNKASANASAAAAWAMLHQGMSLSDIAIEPFSLTEVLRLHILSSGVRIGGFDWNQWQRRGQYQLSDDPCVSFRHTEQYIMKKIMTSSVYDLPPQDKLKILTLISNQCLMLSTVREYMEDAFEQLKCLRKELRTIQHEENQRRRKIQQDKWKKKVEERNKAKEEVKKKKEKKLEEMRQLQQALSNPGTPCTPGTPGTPTTETNPTENKPNDNSPAETKPAENKPTVNNISPQLKEDSTEVDNDKEMEPADELNDSKEQQEQKEKDKLERMRKKEEKEQQLEAFYQEKFLFKESEILKEIAKHSGVISETPVGIDRLYRRYWNFNYVDGLIVENEDVNDAMLDISYDSGNDSEVEAENEMSESENVTTPQAESNSNLTIPNVTFDDIVQAKRDGTPLTRLILTRYHCKYNDHSEEFVLKSNALKPLIEKVMKGVDPRLFEREDIKWYNISSVEQVENILESLNSRGIRESTLNLNLTNQKSAIVDAFEEAEKLTHKKPKNDKHKDDDNEIDKNLFETMDDYIEGNLRDQMLEIEERLWVGSIAGVKCDDRLAWRSTIEQGMVKLIKYNVDKSTARVNGEIHAADESIIVDEKEDKNNVSDLNDTDEKELADLDETVKNGGDDHSNVDGHSNGDDHSNGIADGTSPSGLPLHLKAETIEEDTRCSTPVTIMENQKSPVVKELAGALLLIQRGIEKKFLKPPLGETDDVKREKIKEMVEAALETKDTENNESKEEEEKKSSTCLTRWEESLSKATSFAQIFIHLDTLDRSILWDKSIQNTKCRLCRRKGNEEEMLLCDGCDRGFHMCCLKPPMKKVPPGDWFCPDCRPIEVKTRRNRKPSSKDVEETEEEESDDETEEEEDMESQSDNSDQEEEDEDDDEEDEEEDEEDEEDDDDSSTPSEHGEHCTICEGGGTLILCDECPRSFHVECVYPRLKKVPRGNWSCQICSGLDKELPYKKRAKTAETQREKAEQELTTPKSKQPRKYNRTKQLKSSDTKAKPGKNTKRTSSPLSNTKPAKKPRLSNDINSTPLSTSNRYSGFNRNQLKNCSTLINDVFNHDSAEPFLIPVDGDEVPDYFNFIDTPMDFGTIKRKLNTAKYVDIQNFLDDIQLLFKNCETYNPPRSHVFREGVKLKTFVKKRAKELNLG